MSICPSLDIHSIYVDGELHEKFEAEYLSHISTCSRCREKLEQIKRLKGVFEIDRGIIKLSENDTMGGYKKLEERLKFHTVSRQSDILGNYRIFINKFSMAAAATAIILAVIIPFGISKISSKNAVELDYENLGIENPFSSVKLSMNNIEENNSLLSSTENLRNVELQNIISENKNYASKNPYSKGFEKQPYDPQSFNFSNVYNNENNLYNVSYSYFLGY